MERIREDEADCAALPFRVACLTDDPLALARLGPSPACVFEASVPAGTDFVTVSDAWAVANTVRVRDLAEASPDVRIVVALGTSSSAQICELLRLPVHGLLFVDRLSHRELHRQLRVIAAGGVVLDSEVALLILQKLQILTERFEEQQPGALLSSREREILELVARGLANKEIARYLGISNGTIRAHLRNIFKKLEVTSRAGAAAKLNALPLKPDDSQLKA